MFCTNCGIEFDDGAKVCPNCLKPKWSKLGEIDPNTANNQVKDDSNRDVGFWKKPIAGLVLLLIVVFIVVSFVPMMDIEEEVLVMKQVAEEYTTVEPYIVEKEVEKPYTEYKTKYLWPGRDIPSSESIQEYKVPVVRYSTDIEEVTEYREVTKTRLVERPVIETKTKRVSILRYWLD